MFAAKSSARLFFQKIFQPPPQIMKLVAPLGLGGVHSRYIFIVCCAVPWRFVLIGFPEETVVLLKLFTCMHGSKFRGSVVEMSPSSISPTRRTDQNASVTYRCRPCVVPCILSLCYIVDISRTCFLFGGGGGSRYRMNVSTVRHSCKEPMKLSLIRRRPICFRDDDQKRDASSCAAALHTHARRRPSHQTCINNPFESAMLCRTPPLKSPGVYILALLRRN